MFLSRKIIKIFSCALFEILYVFKKVNINRGKRRNKMSGRAEPLED